MAKIPEAQNRLFKNIFVCKKCKKSFSRQYTLNRHCEKNCEFRNISEHDILKKENGEESILMTPNEVHQFLVQLSKEED